MTKPNTGCWGTKYSLDLIRDILTNIQNPQPIFSNQENPRKVTERFSLWLMKYDNASSEETAKAGGRPRSLFYFYSIYGATLPKKSQSFFTSMLPDICRWHRKDKVDSTELNRTMAIARIQSNINPFVFDPTLADRCLCKIHTDIPPKIHIVNIFPNPSKGLFYIDIEDYKGPVILKISTASGKLIETHHLMYTGLMSWRLEKGIYILNIKLLDKQTFKIKYLIN